MGKKIGGIIAIIVIILINVWLINYAPPDVSEQTTQVETIVEKTTTTTLSTTNTKDTTTIVLDNGETIDDIQLSQSSSSDNVSSINTKDKKSTSEYIKSYKGIVNIVSALLSALILFDMFRPSDSIIHSTSNIHTTNVGRVVIDNRKTENIEINDSVIQRSNIGSESSEKGKDEINDSIIQRSNIDNKLSDDSNDEM